MPDSSRATEHDRNALDPVVDVGEPSSDPPGDIEAIEARERLERRRLILLQGRTDTLTNSVDQTF